MSKFAVITGASSKAIGVLINYLRQDGYQIIAISRKRHHNIEREGIIWKVCDLSSPNQDYSFLKDADLLIHAAAESKAYSLDEYLKNNYQSTINLVDESKRYNVKKIVYISSVLAGYEFGDYGNSKIKSEEYIKQGLINWLIIRPSQMYGYSKNNPIDKLIESLKKRRVIICPIGDNNGINPLHYKDFAKLTYESVIKNEESKIEKIISGPENFTYLELIRKIKQEMKRKVLIIKIPKLLIILIHSFLKLTKLKIRIYPDQLNRFYKTKEIEAHQIGNTYISDYIKNTSKI